MESCGRAEIMRWGLALHLKDLWNLVFRVLAKLMGLPHILLKTFQIGRHVHKNTEMLKVGYVHLHAQMELETALDTLPELSQDVLMSIFATLEIPDLVRAGSVCSNWRSAYKSLSGLGQHKKQQTPCLLYTSESAGENVACLYSLAEQRVYKLTLPAPPIRSRFLIGSSNGWLVTIDESCEIHLINLISGQQVNLPSVITIEHVKPIYNASGSISMYEYSWLCGSKVHHPPSILTPAELRERLCYKAFVYFDEATGGYIVVLIHNPYHQLSFARVGDDKWTWLPPYTDYLNCMYEDGLLYAVTSWGEIHAFEFGHHIITVKIIMKIQETYEKDNSYIIQAPWGDLLHIHRLTDYIDYHPQADPMKVTEKIEIYKVDIAGEKVVEVNCLHGHVLFLGHNQSLCLRAEAYPSLKANHAYFTDDNEYWIKACKSNRRDIGVFNLDNNNREELISTQLWSNWPVPIWITPNLAKMKFTWN
ncbi:hypothetical protein ACP70R_019834 [Stipagrostis hirtigluma subsp. patula]